MAPAPPPRAPRPPDAYHTRPTIGGANGQALAYVYFEGEPGRRSAAHFLVLS